MTDYVHQHFAKHPKPVRPRITCADGFSLSVQASTLHYCSPKANEAPYTHVEVGFAQTPSGRPAAPRSLGGLPSSGVWGWVPLATVNALIARHGGLREG